MIIDPITGLKRCSICTKHLPASAYRPQKDKKDGLRTSCITCTRKQNKAQRMKGRTKLTYMERLNAHLKYMYGSTVEQYNTLLEAQGGVCAICKQLETRIDPRTKKVARLSVDHCHKSGKVRELLCVKCNNIVAAIETNADQIDAYLQYIQKHKEDNK